MEAERDDHEHKCLGVIFNEMSQGTTETGCLMITGGIAAHLVPYFQLMYSPEQLPKLSLNCKSSSYSDEIPERCENDLLETPGEDEETLSMSGNAKDSKRPMDKEGGIRRYLILFKNPVFLLMLFVDFICWVGIYNPIMHLPERARLSGIGINTAAWLASSIILSMTVGRFTLSAICMFCNVDPFYAYGLANGLSGLVTLLSPFLTTETGIFCYAISHGFLNVQVPLIRASAATLLGPEVFPMAYSWILSFNGLALFIGPAVAGYLYDVTLSYNSSFYFSGTCLVFCGTLTLLRNKTVSLSRRNDKSDRDECITVPGRQDLSI